MKTNHLLFGIFLSIILLMLADCTKEPSPAKGPYNYNHNVKTIHGFHL